MIRGLILIEGIEYCPDARNCGCGYPDISLARTTVQFLPGNDRELKVKKLSEDAVIPKYNLAGDVGFDLSSISDYEILPGQTALVKTGLAFEIPENTEVQIRPRSGMSLKTKLRISNSPGTVDSNFRGEVGIIVDNIGHQPHFIKKGDRIAQGVVCPVITVDFVEVSELDSSERNDKGFGSSGV